MKPELGSMVDDNEVPALTVATEQYAAVHKYTGAFLQAFTFRSARRHDPLLAAIGLLNGYMPKSGGHSLVTNGAQKTS